jgi:hypothetical protein
MVFSLVDLVIFGGKPNKNKYLKFTLKFIMVINNKTIVQKSLHILKACCLSFHLKNNHSFSPDPAEVITVFTEALRNFKIFRLPAKNYQINKRKYHIYLYIPFFSLFNADSKYI